MTKTRSRDNRTRQLATLGLLTALALILSYVEVLLPGQPALPGIKLGLANVAVLIALWRYGPAAALEVNLARILLAGLLFTGAFGLLYSLAGGVASFLVMWLLKKSGRFSVIGVSMAGGVLHNLAQLAVAMAMVSNRALLYYYPVLLLSGLVTGILLGVLAKLLLSYLPKQ